MLYPTISGIVSHIVLAISGSLPTESAVHIPSARTPLDFTISYLALRVVGSSNHGSQPRVMDFAFLLRKKIHFDECPYPGNLAF